jgi:hypothetical protein
MSSAASPAPSDNQPFRYLEHLVAKLRKAGLVESQRGAHGGYRLGAGRTRSRCSRWSYVERRPDPADRRAKLIFPTERGLDQLRLGDRIIADIEARHASEVGARTYAQFRDVLRGVVARRTQFKEVTASGVN